MWLKEQAIQDFDEAIHLSSQNAAPYTVMRGMTYASLGQHERALQDFAEAIRLDPQLAEACAARGGTYAGLGQRELAMQDYNEAIRFDPSYANLLESAVEEANRQR